MHLREGQHRVCRWVLATALGLLINGSAVSAQDRHVSPAPPETVERQFGPYDVHVLAGGAGITKALPDRSSYLLAGTPYTLLLWVEMSPTTPADTLLAGLGDPTEESSRFLALAGGRPVLRYGAHNSLQAPTTLPSSGWHLLTATFDGTQQHLYVDSAEAAHGTLADARVLPRIVIAPPEKLAHETFQHFGGGLAGITLLANALTPAEVAARAAHPPDTAFLRYEEASPSWPVQTRGQAGYAEPQDASVMPHSRTALPNTPPRAVPVTTAPALKAAGPDRWEFTGGWMLASALDITADPAAMSTAGFKEPSDAWLQATVPGTVLTTMVDRGKYPDPDFGLNNLAIPESLNQHDYWYRIEFDAPRGVAGRRLTLTFNGINYAAAVWLNGHPLGDIKGAFIRGTFDVSSALSTAHRNALAVRVSPPPHPGIPEEQSILAGPGENGGTMCLDGPTFVATEGWDWIPAIRDRNTGIWQNVVLTAAGTIVLGDPKVVTHLPLPDTSSADVEISVPVRNTAAHTVAGTVNAAFEGVTLTKHVTLKPGETTVTLRPSEFRQLHLPHPRLWWPNGYGSPDLYHLKVSVSAGRADSDQKLTTFGIREITYELSAFDSSGRLRRVEYDPAAARIATEDPAALPALVDVSHAGLRRTAEYWAPSLTPAGEHSPAVASLPNPQELTDLVLKVNGVRVAARGGNWGMDDSRKRVSREHLEPYFRLHREAGLNIIRNWVGQDTEETFFQLADEYGLMVWNDFWASTQDYNVEPQDVPLFLANARDVVRRFRNHPSIVVWCGRNEGVPQPILNDGLIAIFREEDGTRYYTPGSNRIDLRNSGPYHYQEPSLYYTTLDRGFSVELGIASLSTLEALKASIAPADLWPISDAWAYHDWHASGNGDTHPLVDAMERQLGSSNTLEDFERKAQMFNYVDHRAIFEGFNQHLWTPNSGRMLWMTQPAWPSNVWQIFSSDYDTNASYYGVKKACEPLHIQLDLSDYTVAAVNTTNLPAPGMHMNAAVYSLDNRPLLKQDQALDLPADVTTSLPALPLRQFFAAEGVVLVRLTLQDHTGRTVSENSYWLAASDADYRRLGAVPSVPLTATATSRIEGDETAIALTLTNTANVPAIQAKATLLDASTGERILPAYFSDNYVTLLPGETTHLTIRVPAGTPATHPRIALRGFNVVPGSADVLP